jgi:hypothetical protein
MLEWFEYFSPWPVVCIFCIETALTMQGAKWGPGRMIFKSGLNTRDVLLWSQNNFTHVQWNPQPTITSNQIFMDKSLKMWPSLLISFGAYFIKFILLKLFKRLKWVYCKDTFWWDVLFVKDQFISWVQIKAISWNSKLLNYVLMTFFSQL